MTELWAGLAIGAVYAFVALGYNVTYLASGVLNFAQAHFLVVGMFVAYWAHARGDIPLVLVFLLAAVVAGLGGLVEERTAVRLLGTDKGSAELVTLIGVATIITGVLILVFGADALRVPSLVSETPFALAGGRVQPLDVVLVLLAVVLGVVLHLATHRTRIGLAALAQTDDREAAQLRGIDVGRLSLYGFALAAALAGLLGPLVVAKTFAAAGLPIVLAVKGFVVLVLGGVGSHRGTVIAAFAVGVVEAFGARYAGPAYRDVLVFVLFVGVLLLFPQGLFGGAKARTV